MSIQPLSPSRENTLSLSIHQSWTEYQLSLSGFDRCKKISQDNMAVRNLSQNSFRQNEHPESSLTTAAFEEEL